MDYYVYQHPHYAIGNFINCTPSIKILADHLCEKVPVLFSSNPVRDMYTDSEFIYPVTSCDIKDKELICSSDDVQGNASFAHLLKPDLSNYLEVSERFISKPDWQRLAEMTMENLGVNRDIPHTFVDECDKPKEIESSNYCVILRGCATHSVGANGQGCHFHIKDPGVDIYKHIIEHLNQRSIRAVFLGAEDNKKNIAELSAFAKNPIVILNNIRKSLGAINHAKFIISNDTGLYHAAAALNKKTFILWNNTPFTKNRAPGVHNTFSQRGHWIKDYLDWTEQNGAL